MLATQRVMPYLLLTYLPVFLHKDTADALHVLGADGFPHHNEYKHKLAQLWKDFCKSSDAHAMHCDGKLGHSAKRAVWELIHEEVRANPWRARLHPPCPAPYEIATRPPHAALGAGARFPHPVVPHPTPAPNPNQVHAFPTSWYRIFPSMFTNAHEALQELDPDKFLTPLDAIIRDFLRFRELHNPLAGYA